MNTSLTSSSSAFIFDAEHNGVPCIASTRPEDQGTEHQIWFTRKMLREIYGVKSEDTITNHVEALVKRGVVTVAKNLATVQITNSVGAVNKTTLYDLKVFNFLAMRLDTDRAWEVKEKFNDILVEKETNKFPIPETFEDALILAGQQMKLAKEEARKRIQAEQERDEAIRTKTLYHEGLASEMSGRVGGLQKANNSLRKENSELKDAVGRGCNWRTVSMMKAEWIKEFGHVPSWQKLKQFSKDVGIPPVQDVEEKVVLKDGSEKTTVSYRYHKEAWARYKKYEENLRVTQDEVSLV